MVAFVDDHLPVIGDDIADDALAHEALHDSDGDRLPAPIVPIDRLSISRKADRRFRH
jgi:hypothetical protein